MLGEAMFKNDDQCFAEHTTDFDMAVQQREHVTNSAPGETASAEAAAIYKLAANNYATNQAIISKVDFLMGWYAALEKDLPYLAGSGGGGSNKATTFLQKQPAWMADCNEDVIALTEEDGVSFESHGRTETALQQKARKQRDSIYEANNHLWDDGGPSWGKLPEKHKVALCNRLGRPPLKWCPALSAKRVSNYINTRKARLRKADRKRPSTSSSSAQRQGATPTGEDEETKDEETVTPLKKKVCVPTLAQC